MRHKERISKIYDTENPIHFIKTDDNKFQIFYQEQRDTMNVTMSNFNESKTQT
jgi:hypothetical protein